MADTQMGEDGVGREESGGEESSAPWLSQLPLGETRIFYRLQALNYVLLTLTYTQPSFHMPRVMSMLLDAICLELERSPMSPHAHADQRTTSTWCKMRTSYTRPLSLSPTKPACAREMRQTLCTLPIPWIHMCTHGGMLAHMHASQHNLHAKQESAAYLVAAVRRRAGEGPWRRWRKRTAGVSTHVTQHTLGSATPPRGQHRELG